MSKLRQTKILATLGPVSHSAEMIKALVGTGVNVFRLNFSHGEHKDHKQVCALIRDLEKELGQPLGVLADLQGPKIRVGQFAKGHIELKEGQRLTFDQDEEPGDKNRISLPHPEVFDAVDKGSLLYIDDGKVRVEILEKKEGRLIGTVLAGSKLSDRKGVNVPGAVIPIPALTDKDKEDLKVALEMGADWIAQSFVQKPEDVKEAKELIDGQAALMVKLEKPSALEHLDEIIKLADGVMIARGDLGIEIPAQKVPTVQKDVIDKVRVTGKPVVVATQMLESMIDNPQPTRAEVSDVATAVFDGADAVMLSAETASGFYPLEAVQIMDVTAREIESNVKYLETMERRRERSVRSTSDAITIAARNVAFNVEAALIVTYTTSGSTALRMARQRPDIPILCLTPDENAARRLSLSYGVHAVHAPETAAEDFTGPARYASKIILDQGFAEKADRFVMTAGMPFATPGSTNILRVAKVE